ncbi:sensor histidine kinase [Micromonospora zhanjiangensis]|uniref:histidine kinase n=1 Tax=Micromonospora zhanjiangensis TaxID=1522057 RepID=A0ABV8KV53_9ACTN
MTDPGIRSSAPRAFRGRTVGRATPTAIDVLLALSLATLTGIAGTGYRMPSHRSFDAWAWALTFAVALPLAVRRRYALPALLVSCAAYTGYLAAGYQPSVNWVAPPLALYTVVALRPRRIALVGAAAVAWVVFYSGWQARVLPLSVVLGQVLLIVGIAWLFGTNARLLARRNAQLAALTARLRHEQQERAQRAVTEERMRIARDLHDDVAHHMSVVSVQAALAQYVFTSNPATARVALDAIAEAGRQAQRDLRHLLAALRIGPDGTEDGAPTPGLDRLDDLVDRVRRAGQPVDVVVNGRPRRLPNHLDLCVYRMIQEALTNVLRHAGPAHATVTLDYRPEQILVRVTDDGRGDRAGPGDRVDPGEPGEPVGHGLIGMRERARLFDGTVASGNRPGGGFEVVLTLPCPETPAHDAACPR